MSDLPTLHSDSHLLNSAFRIALGDLVGNIQPFQDGLLAQPERCILAGLEYDTPWTRDTAINTWNGAGLIFPEAARNTLLSVLERRAGRLLIGGQYWDAIIWTTGAWAYYLYTGDRNLLAMALEATRNSLEYFEATEFDPATGLFRGPACYGDGVAAYPDRYAQTGGTSSILDWPRSNPQQAATPGYGLPMQALSTNCLYYNAYRLAGEMARELGQPALSGWQAKDQALKEAINRDLWDPAQGNYRYLVDEWGGSDHQEGLGSSFALLFGVASEEQARQVIHSQYITAHGIPCVWPTFERYKLTPDSYGRHSGTVWPHVQGFWAEAALRSGAVELFNRELFGMAEKAVRDGMFAEIYHPVDGSVYGGVQEAAPGWQWHSCVRQTWSATAFLRLVLFGLFGMRFSPQGIAFEPMLSEGITRLELRGLPYRGSLLHLTLSGQGDHLSSFQVNQQVQSEAFLPADASGEQHIDLRLS